MRIHTFIRTAALCVAKLYDLKLELVIDDGYGFLEQLQEMIIGVDFW
jgi:hypothetical protein